MITAISISSVNKRHVYKALRCRLFLYLCLISDLWKNTQASNGIELIKIDYGKCTSFASLLFLISYNVNYLPYGIRSLLYIDKTEESSENKSYVTTCEHIIVSLPLPKTLWSLFVLAPTTFPCFKSPQKIANRNSNVTTQWPIIKDGICKFSKCMIYAVSHFLDFHLF